jgi:hypothetical protein
LTRVEPDQHYLGATKHLYGFVSTGTPSTYCTPRIWHP